MRLATLAALLFASASAAQPGFVPNHGQWDASAHYLARLDGFDAWVTDDGLRLNVYEIDATDADPLARRSLQTTARHVRGEVIDLALAETGPITFHPATELATRVSYLRGEARWHAAGIRPVGALGLGAIAPDVMLTLRPDGGQMELVVETASAEALAAARFAGATLHTTADGALVMATAIGERVIGRLSVSVAGAPPRAGRLHADGSLAVGVPLATAPAASGGALEYATFLGGGGEELAYNVALDADGRAVLAGQTLSPDFPTTPGAYDGTLGGGPDDAFVVRLSADGSSLEYATFLGGSGGEVAYGLDVDSEGRAVIAGLTLSDDFPTTDGAQQSTYGGATDAFVARLSPDGEALEYGTYLGGSDLDAILGVAVAADGAAVVSGVTNSVDFPVTPGAFDESYNGTSGFQFGDAFVARVAPDGRSLVYSTFLGGPGEELSEGVVLDGAERAYVVGFNTEGGFPTTAGAFDRTQNGFVDAFAARLSADGSALDYATYLGGGDNDDAFAAAVTPDGRLAVTGVTSSSNFPTTPGAYDRTRAGFADAFVSILSSDGGSLEASTLIGGSEGENLAFAAFDAQDQLVAVGNSGSPDFPSTPGAAGTQFGGDVDGVVVRLSTDLSDLDYSSYLGGSGEDTAIGVALDGDAAVVVGRVGGDGFPTTPGAYDTSYNGGDDAYVARLPLTVMVAGEAEPEASGLSAPFPNPAAGWIGLEMVLPSPASLRAEAVDALGRTVAILADGVYEAGSHRLVWGASDAAPGVYVVRVVADTGSGRTTWTERVTVVR